MGYIPLPPGQTEQVKALMDQLKEIQKQEEKLKHELRKLIYKL